MKTMEVIRKMNRNEIQKSRVEALKDISSVASDTYALVDDNQQFLEAMDMTLTDIERHGENIEFYLMRISEKLDAILEKLGGEQDETAEETR